jgi:hypothetical protein
LASTSESGVWASIFRTASLLLEGFNDRILYGAIVNIIPPKFPTATDGNAGFIVAAEGVVLQGIVE